jgi:hypothetical protein
MSWSSATKQSELYFYPEARTERNCTNYFSIDLQKQPSGQEGGAVARGNKTDLTGGQEGPKVHFYWKNSCEQNTITLVSKYRKKVSFCKKIHLERRLSEQIRCYLGG